MSLCVSAKERQAEIADMCSFYLAPEKGNAMRMLAARASDQTVRGTGKKNRWRPLSFVRVQER